MLKPLFGLGRTNKPAFAAGNGVELARRICFAHRMRAAHRASGGEDERLRPLWPLFKHHRDNLRNHIPCPLHHHSVANAHVLAGNFIGVMQRGVRHHHPANGHRFQLGNRGERACAAHLNFDIFKKSCGFFRRKLVGNRPARGARHKPQPLLQLQIIDLVNHPINVIAKIGPLRLNGPINGEQIFRRVAEFGERVHLKAPPLHCL